MSDIEFNYFLHDYYMPAMTVILLLLLLDKRRVLYKAEVPVDLEVHLQYQLLVHLLELELHISNVDDLTCQILFDQSKEVKGKY